MTQEIDLADLAAYARQLDKEARSWTKRQLQSTYSQRELSKIDGEKKAEQEASNSHVAPDRPQQDD